MPPTPRTLSTRYLPRSTVPTRACARAMASRDIMASPATVSIDNGPSHPRIHLSNEAARDVFAARLRVLVLERLEAFARDLDLDLAILDDARLATEARVRPHVEGL